MNLQEQFNNISRKYDGQRKKLIPCFDDFYGIAVESLDLQCVVPVILDLGAGTGLFSSKVLEKYPTAHLTLLDISEEMMRVAAERFEGLPDVRIAHADLTALAIEENNYDAIISSLAIHHLTDKEKYILYIKILSGLKPGGVFVNAEQVLADTPFLEEIYSTEWRKKVEGSDLSEADIKAAYERVKLDKRTPLSTQLEWLKEIGYEEVDCRYKHYDFVVIWAKKASIDR